MLNDSGNNRRGGRPAPPPRASAAAARRNQSTMNRPGAESLNSNAEATVAAKFFAKDIGGENYRPSLANAFIAPVIEKKPEEEVKSPFKAAPKAPIKRPKNITNAALGSDEEEEHKEEKKAPAGPQIARFMDIPIVEKPKSPFVPLGEKPQSENGLKAPIKRPASASINHAAAQQEEEKKPSPLAKAPEAKPAFKSNAFAPSPFAQGAPKNPEAPSPFVPLKSSQPKTLEKTFIPLAPIPEEKHQEEETFNPFAPRVEKTEEQLRIEEENARRALENSIREPKKSALDKLMDNLNKPLF